MKNISRWIISLSFIALSVSCIYLFLDNKAKSREIIRLQDIFPPATPPNDVCPTSYTGGMNWVKLKDVVSMVREYGNNQAHSVDSLMNKKLIEPGAYADTRFITFPMDTIKKFIDIIERQTTNANLLNDNGSVIKRCDLGIKFFYSAYVGLGPRVDAKHPFNGKHTLVLIPTYLRSSNGLYTEFSPFYAEGNRPMSFLEIMKIDSNTVSSDKMVAFSVSENDLDVGKNHGSLCPPPACASEILQLASVKNK